MIRRILLFLLLCSVPAWSRTQLKPGFNLISRQQEVQLGQEAAAQYDRQLRLDRDARLNNMVRTIGSRLARYSPARDYPYTFKVVQDNSINAFALPGGPVYINSGTIAATENESQLAGVIAHEIAHVALRHGTSNASKAMLARFPMAVVGGVIGSGSVAGQLAQMGIGIGVGSVLLKYSRTAERQADILGTQIMYDAGYNPEELARFFEKIERSERTRSVQFLSDHPNPGDREAIVRREIATLGPRRR